MKQNFNSESAITGTIAAAVVTDIPITNEPTTDAIISLITGVISGILLPLLRDWINHRKEKKSNDKK